eukprot:gene6374-7488_t
MVVGGARTLVLIWFPSKKFIVVEAVGQGAAVGEAEGDSINSRRSSRRVCGRL